MTKQHPNNSLTDPSSHGLDRCLKLIEAARTSLGAIIGAARLIESPLTADKELYKKQILEKARALDEQLAAVQAIIHGERFILRNE